MSQLPHLTNLNGNTGSNNNNNKNNNNNEKKQVIYDFLKK